MKQFLTPPVFAAVKFFDCKLADIRRADIQKYITLRLSAEASCGSVIKELNTLKHLKRHRDS
jgi:hypothetical protein